MRPALNSKARNGKARPTPSATPSATRMASLLTNFIRSKPAASKACTFNSVLPLAVNAMSVPTVTLAACGAALLDSVSTRSFSGEPLRSLEPFFWFRENSKAPPRAPELLGCACTIPSRMAPSEVATFRLPASLPLVRPKTPASLGTSRVVGLAPRRSIREPAWVTT